MHQIDLNDKQFVEERYGKIKGWVPGAIKKGKVNPQVTMAIREDGTFVSVFHVKPVYYETPAGEWRPLSEVTVHHGNRSIILNENWWNVHPRYLAWLDKRCKLIGGQLLIPSTFKSYPTPYAGVIRSLHESLVPVKIGLTVSTFYPDPHPETTSVDGHVRRSGVVETWATIRGGAGTFSDDTSASREFAGAYAFTSTGNWNELYRSPFLFDTSALPDTDDITAATFSVYVSSKSDPHDEMSWCLVSSNPASNTALVNGDFTLSTKFGSTRFATDKTYASISTSAYCDFTLNSAGIDNVSKTAISKFGLLTAQDFDNSAPTWASSTYKHITGYYAERTGTSEDPKLVVTHSAPSSAVNSGFFNFFM